MESTNLTAADAANLNLKNYINLKLLNFITIYSKHEPFVPCYDQVCFHASKVNSILSIANNFARDTMNTNRKTTKFD